MSTDLDLKLYHHAPQVKCLPGEKKFAIYSMAALNQREMQNLERDLNSAEFVENDCELSPRASFAGLSLAAVLDYHLTLRARDAKFHPLLFIVATHKNYQDFGVLFVYLNTDGKGGVGHARCTLDMAASYCMNIDIGNMEWDEVKDEETFEWPAYFRMPTSVPSTGLMPRKQFGVYTFNAEFLGAKSRLDGNWEDKDAAQQRFFHAATIPGPGGPDDHTRQWNKLSDEHVNCCMRFPQMHRELCLVVEHSILGGLDTVALVRFRWIQNPYGVVTQKSPKPRWELICRTIAVRAIMVLSDFDITPPSMIGIGNGIGSGRGSENGGK